MAEQFSIEQIFHIYKSSFNWNLFNSYESTDIQSVYSSSNSLPFKLLTCKLTFSWKFFFL